MADIEAVWQLNQQPQHTWTELIFPPGFWNSVSAPPSSVDPQGQNRSSQPASSEQDPINFSNSNLDTCVVGIVHTKHRLTMGWAAAEIRWTYYCHETARAAKAFVGKMSYVHKWTHGYSSFPHTERAINWASTGHQKFTICKFLPWGSPAAICEL